jgi:hypothetical protein
VDLFDEIEAVSWNETSERKPLPHQAVTTTEPKGSGDEWDDLAFDVADEPTPEAEAADLGRDKAGTPSWSELSANRIQKRLQAILDRLPEEDRPAVLQAFDDAYRAERRRRVAFAAMDAEAEPQEVEL